MEILEAIKISDRWQVRNREKIRRGAGEKWAGKKIANGHTFIYHLKHGRTKMTMWKTILSLATALVLFASTGYAQYECVRGDCTNGTGKLAVTGSTAYMEGKFVNGVLVQGKVAFPNGNVFEGEYEEHKLIKGIKKYKNGQVQEGKFIDGVLVEGKFTDKNGTTRFIKLKSLGAM